MTREIRIRIKLNDNENKNFKIGGRQLKQWIEGNL